MRAPLITGLFCVTAVTSCSPAAPVLDRPDRLVIQTPNGTAEEVGTRVPLSVAAVRSRDDTVVPGATVRWVVESGTGTLDPASVVTGPDGVATTELVVGPGENRILASVDGTNALARLLTHGCSRCGEWVEVSARAESRPWASAVIVSQAIWLMGGLAGELPTDSIAVFEPEQNSWRASGQPMLPTPLVGSAAATLDEKVYVIGGTNSDLFYSLIGERNVRSYDTRTGTWEARAFLATGRFFAASATMDGKIYVAGGYTNCVYIGWCPGPAVSSVEIYDPVADHWIMGPPMNRRRAMAGAAVLGDRLLVGGGVDDEFLWQNSPIATMEELDPVIGTWRDLGNPPFAGPVKLVTVGGALYAVETAALLHKQQRSRLYVYDDGADEWDRLRDLPVALLGPAIVGFDGHLYAIGGYVNATDRPYVRPLSRSVWELRR